MPAVTVGVRLRMFLEHLTPRFARMNHSRDCLTLVADDARCFMNT